MKKYSTLLSKSTLQAVLIQKKLVDQALYCLSLFYAMLHDLVNVGAACIHLGMLKKACDEA